MPRQFRASLVPKPAQQPKFEGNLGLGFRVLGFWCPTFQNPLVKEYTLNHSRNMI